MNRRGTGGVPAILDLSNSQAAPRLWGGSMFSYLWRRLLGGRSMSRYRRCRRPAREALSPLRVRLHLEHLETRYAPATVLSASQLSYQDADGDSVTVSFSKPFLNNGNVNDIFQFDVGDASSGNADMQQLLKI